MIQQSKPLLYLGFMLTIAVGPLLGCARPAGPEVVAKPIADADVFRGIGVYAWRLVITLPRDHEANTITLSFDGLSGPVSPAFVKLPVPNGEARRIELTVVLHFDGSSIGQSDKAGISLGTASGATKVTQKNPLAGFASASWAESPVWAGDELRLITMSGADNATGKVALVLSKSE